MDESSDIPQAPDFDSPEFREGRDRLIAEIERVFADVTREGGVSISEADVIDDYGSEEEQAAARASDTDTHWSQLDPERQDPGGSALSFMDAIGFRYYLPACMVFTLRHGFVGLEHPDCIEWNGYDSIPFHAADICSKTTHTAKLTAEQFSLFDEGQRRAVARFLAFNAEWSWDEIDRRLEVEALSGYWRQFLTPDEYDELRRRVPELEDEL